MLQNKSSLTFETEWPSLQPIILKLLSQDPVSHREWQDLFWSIHSICLWDDKGPPKIFLALKSEILTYVRGTQRKVLIDSTAHYALLRRYIVEWSKFLDQCSYLPKPFAQLETIIKTERKRQSFGHCLVGTSPYDTSIQLNGTTSNDTRGSVNLSNRSSGYNSSSSIVLSPLRQTRDSDRNEEEKLIRKLMLDVWSQSIFNAVKKTLQRNALDLVWAERNGETFDSQLVIGVRESFVNLCSDPDDPLLIYRENFEKAYLDSVKTYYNSECQGFLDKNGVENYLKYANTKLIEEEQRGRRYLETKNGSKSLFLLVEVCVQVMVESFKDRILAELPRLIKINDLGNLNLMYKLIARTRSGIEPMLSDIESHIIQDGLDDMISSAPDIVTDSEKYVEKLLTLFNRYSDLIKSAFDNDPRFLTSRDKAFKQVLNDTTVFKLDLSDEARKNVQVALPNNVPHLQSKFGPSPTINHQTSTSNGPTTTTFQKTSHCPPESKCPQLLANYCDMLLRKTAISKKMTPEEIEQKLKLVLQLLKYVQNKDVFMRYHRFNLGRRLILDTSMDSEKEENMVEWLRAVGMPADYISKLSRMFQDIKVSKDLNDGWKESIKCEKREIAIADKVNVKILNASAWAKPSYKVPVSLPIELEDAIPDAEEYYKGRHSGRKLQWYHALSYGIMAFKTSEGGSFDLEVTTFQISVLNAWNNRRRGQGISFENLKLATELPEAELRRTLWSLVAFPKLKSQLLTIVSPDSAATTHCDGTTLVKSPKEFTDNTLFAINQRFVVTKNNKTSHRGKVNLIGRSHLLTSDNTLGEENKAIVQLREIRIQEAINKIMKTRRKLTNAQLHTELIELLKNMFLPQRKMVKEQIEWLIEQKFLGRDPVDINTFIYIA